MSVKYRTRGQYKVEFPLSQVEQFDVFYTGLEIRQKIRQHDIATIRVRTTKLKWLDAFPTGAPVTITYHGQDRILGTFVGYVTNIRPVLAEEEGYYMRDIVCVAASRDLRATARQTYRNRTAPEIVQAIGKQIGFRVVTQQHGLRRPTVTHSGDTYWEFLTKLAKRTGYVLRVEGTTILFMPLPDLIKMYISRAPFLTDYADMGTVGNEPPNVHSIDAWAGDTSDDPDDLSDSTTYTAIEPTTGRVHNERQTPTSALHRGVTSRSPYDRYPSDVAVHSREDARLLAKGAADNGMMAFDTKMTVAGESGLKPYRPVTLNVKDGALDGTWVVKEAVHRLAKGQYTCDVVVSTESVVGGAVGGSRGARKTRDLGAEVAQGVAPDIMDVSRLKSMTTGPGAGMTGSTGRWVAR